MTSLKLGHLEGRSAYSVQTDLEADLNMSRTRLLNSHKVTFLNFLYIALFSTSLISEPFSKGALIKIANFGINITEKLSVGLPPEPNNRLGSIISKFSSPIVPISNGLMSDDKADKSISYFHLIQIMITLCYHDKLTKVFTFCVTSSVRININLLHIHMCPNV